MQTTACPSRPPPSDRRYSHLRMVTYRRILSPFPPFGDSPAPAPAPASAPVISLPAPACPPFPMAIIPPPFKFGIENWRNRRIANLLLIGGSIIAAVFLLSLTFYAVLRRRPQRPAVALAGPSEDDDASLGDGDPVHHVWYIRTVGLDESTISSITVAEYRTGDALLDGAWNCSVCLGEFHDGERVRLLPKCGHVFHVPCIDIWLRAHVNCPLCRAHVVDSDSGSAPPSADALTASVPISGGSVESDSDSSTPAGIPQIGVPPMEERNEGLHNAIGIGMRVRPFEAYDSLPESSSSREQSALVGHGLPPVRRSASMGEPLMNSIIGRLEPEQRFIDKEGGDVSFGEKSAPTWNFSKGVMDQRGQSDMKRSLSSNGMGFFFSRRGRVARIHSMPL